MAEVRGDADTTFAFESQTRLGDQTYHCERPGKAFTQQQVARMIQSARSLRETEATKAAVTRDAEAIGRWTGWGGITDLGNQPNFRPATRSRTKISQVKDVAG